jgi:hypothetical protein
MPNRTTGFLQRGRPLDRGTIALAHLDRVQADDTSHNLKPKAMIAR